MIRLVSTRFQSPLLSMFGIVVCLALVSPFQSAYSSAGKSGTLRPAQQSEDIRLLSLGAPFEREISGDQTQAYRITLATGQLFRCVIRQMGFEVSVTLTGPDGQKLDVFDEPIGENRNREIFFIVQTDGDYGVSIRLRGKNVPTARYQIQVEELRLATEQDRTRARAVKLVRDARQVYWKTTPVTNEEAQKYLEAFDEAMRLWQLLGDQWMVAETLLDMGLVNGRLGEYTKALELFEKALPLFPQTPEGEASKATTLNNIANVNYRIGETHKALEFYLQSLALKKDGWSRAISLDNIGGVYRRLGEYQLALDHHQQALAIFRKLGKTRDEAIALNNTATLLGNVGEFGRALEYLLQALELIRKTGDKVEESLDLYNIGHCYLSMGDHRQALEYANQSVKLALTIKNRQAEADGMTLLCKVYEAMGDYENALNACNRALPLHRANKDLPTEADTLTSLGSVYAKKGDNAKAIESSEAALAIYRATDDTTGELSALHALGRFALEGGDLDSARKLLEQAIALTESLRANVGSHQLRLTYMAGVQGVYESYVDLLMQFHQREPGKGYEQTALQFSERVRARGLLDLLAESRAQIRQGADAGLLEKERILLQRLNDKDAVWKRIRNNERTKKQAEIIAAEINELTTQLELVEVQLRSSSPRYAELTHPRTLPFAEIQNRLLDENTVLLEFSLGKRQSWLWAVTPNTISSYRLPARREIETATRKVYELLIARQPGKGESEAEWKLRVAEADSKLDQESVLLSRMLLGQIATRLRQEWKGKRLLVVAGGALEYLPFAMLPLPSENNESQRLIAEHEIVNLPSASVLSSIRREKSARQLPAKTVAILADPVFEANDPRVILATRNRTRSRDVAVRTRSEDETETQASDLQLSLRSLAENSVRGNLSRLPFSREEADAITSFVPAKSYLKATDFQANREKAMSGELADYRIVHFATHGLLNSEHPELSGLVLSLVDESGRSQNGFLRMHEIYNLRLPAEVVVLSACQTGLGKEIKGEGLVGLTRGFMYAGTQRVVASLWQVDDLATAELMERFYRGMLKDGLRPAAALREAQIEMMKEKRWKSPYFWASFVLSGDWQ